MQKTICLLPGDGIGPEIVAEAVKVLRAVEKKFGHSFTMTEALLGGAAIDAVGVPLPDATVEACKAAGHRVALATNPIFPAVATESRIRWAGLAPETFAWYTTYENIGYCKPNPDYYREILRYLGCRAEDCLMVGNDVEEDMMAAQAAGLSVFLLTDCLLNRKEKDISSYPQGDFDALLAFVEEWGGEASL